MSVCVCMCVLTVRACVCVSHHVCMAACVHVSVLIGSDDGVSHYRELINCFDLTFELPPWPFGANHELLQAHQYAVHANPFHRRHHDDKVLKARQHTASREALLQ